MKVRINDDMYEFLLTAEEIDARLPDSKLEAELEYFAGEKLGKKFTLAVGDIDEEVELKISPESSPLGEASRLDTIMSRKKYAFLKKNRKTSCMDKPPYLSFQEYSPAA